MEDKFNITLDSGTDKVDESNKWICRVCGQRFRVRWELEDHRKSMSHYLKNHTSICNVDGESFRVRKEWDQQGDVHVVIEAPKWECTICGQKFLTRRLLDEHRKSVHPGGLDEMGRKVRKLRSDDVICKYCGREFKSNGPKALHELHGCKLNPNRSIIPGHPLSEESRKKISESMKKAHADGRAFNIGLVNWKVTKSYPESWFTSVIENRFDDKEYEYNFQVGPYKLDFAWPKKMRYIEIDGDQHYRFQECIDKDERRDKYLTEKGWTLLRRSWSCILLDKELFITESKRFIDDVEDLPPELQYRDKRKEYIQSLNDSGISCINGSNKLRLSSDEVAEYIRRKDLILSSGIDMTKFGWKRKVAEKIGITKRMVDKTVNRFPEIFKDAYKDHRVGKRK